MSATTITPELRQTLRRLKLSPLLETLPERLELARQQNMSHAELLELVLSDEIDRRDRHAAARRARSARLNPTMTLEAWDETTGVTYDRQLWNELTTLRFVDDALNTLILGPVGVGKTHLAHALGHIACRRRLRVHADRADQLFKRLAASRLDGSHDAELRRLAGVDLLIVDLYRLRNYAEPPVVGPKNRRRWGACGGW